MNPYNRYNENAGRSNDDVLKKLYPEICLPHVDKELQYLVRAFGARPFCGSGHPAPCSAWRTERIQHGGDQESDPRFTNRVHLFEGPREGEHFVARGQMGPGQRYLGYVNLRPVDQAENSSPYTEPVGEKGARFYLRYAATATLAPPGFMLRPRYHVITCVAGPSEGVMPFRAVPFSHPEQFGQTRARCMHVALHCALMLKANVYHAIPLNSQDMVTALWEQKNAMRPEGDPPIAMEALQKAGLSIRDARDLLASKAVRAGGVLEWISESTVPLPRSDSDEKYLFREALRTITDYVANGVPVILEIGPERPDALENETNHKEWERYRESLTRQEGRGHAWLVIGFRMMYDPDEDQWPLTGDNDDELQRIDMRELPSRFVVHDQFEGPYYRVYAARLLRRAWIEQEVQEGGKILGPGVRFLAVLPHHARIGVQEVRRRVQKLAPEFDGEWWRGYLVREVGHPAPDPSEAQSWYKKAQYVVRLLRAREVEQRYLGSPTRKNPALTDKAELCQAREALRQAMDQCQVPTLIRHTEGAREEQSPVSWWWAVEVRHHQREPKAPPRRRRAAPALVYLWPIHADPEGDIRAPALIQYEDTTESGARVRLWVEEESYACDWFADDADGGDGFSDEGETG
jgi:hypothetical protein